VKKEERSQTGVFSRNVGDGKRTSGDKFKTFLWEPREERSEKKNQENQLCVAQPLENLPIILKLL
jgi:hypothetical protein